MAFLIKDYTTQAGRRILVIDHAIPEEIGHALYAYFNQHVLWSFDANDAQDGDNVQFVHGLENELMADSPLWQYLERYLTKFFGPGYLPYNCSVNHTRQGDSPMEHQDTYDASAQDVSLLLYLNPRWNLNFAGETVYFDEKGEIEFSVLPKFLRLAIHEGYIRHASRPPTPACTSSRYTLAIKAATEEAYRTEQIAAEQASEDEGQASALEQTLFGRIRPAA